MLHLMCRIGHSAEWPAANRPIVECMHFFPPAGCSQKFYFKNMFLFAIELRTACIILHLNAGAPAF